jgi:hypothetical protein
MTARSGAGNGSPDQCPVTLPIILEQSDVEQLLGITSRQVDLMIADGRLEDCTIAGLRRTFCARQVLAMAAEKSTRLSAALNSRPWGTEAQVAYQG